jgi:hypothetical protein
MLVEIHIELAMMKNSKIPAGMPKAEWLGM